MYDFACLSNGMRIIGNPMKAFRSVSVGLWIDSGSVFESKDEAGISHFIEHMLFKGTQKRSARQIAEEMDAVGGNMNAFTDKECTCFYTRVVDEHLPLALDMLADMVLSSRFDPEDIKKEKGVVLEEINMCEDTPDDLVFDLLDRAHFGTQCVGRPILGTAASVSAITRESIVNYMYRRYRPQGAVLALAGSYDWDSVVALAKSLFEDWTAAPGREESETFKACRHKVLRKEKRIEQTHWCVGFDGPETGSKDKYPVNILNTVLGGSMSSRLFQKIREEHGLAYSVASGLSTTIDSGLFYIYAATSPENARPALELALDECRRLASEGITEKEFNQARQQVTASIIMGSESTGTIMRSLGGRMLQFGDTRTVDDIINSIKAVTLDEVNLLAAKVLGSKRSGAIVGAKTKSIEDALILED